MTAKEEEGETPDQTPFLSIGVQDGRTAVQVYFEEDWQQGIGGGLWSTGLAFGKYLTTSHAAENLEKTGRGISVLELGSGNGLLSVCLLALAKHLQAKKGEAIIIEDLVVTDLEDHLPLIQKTLDANQHLSSAATKIHVLEHAWGKFAEVTGAADSTTSTFSNRVQSGQHKFDLILGSDVAYHPDLYDILIASMQQYAHAKTVLLIGVTMNDTKPEFFHKLRKAGFQYRKFADHLLDKDFQGRTFGIFQIQKL